MRLFLLLVLFLTACTPANKLHRGLPPTDAACFGVLRNLGPANNERRGDQVAASDCYLQRHLVPVEEGTPGWKEEAEEQGAAIKDPETFHLAFVEMGDNGRLLQPSQLSDLQAHLRGEDRAGRQNVVVAFVHGWRHDASLGDRDVQKMRILLGYTRAFLNSRCLAQGSYCDASLTGVFIGWRGRSFAEPLLTADGGFSPFALGAFPTIWDRKRQSDRHAALLGQVLEGVEAPLALKAGNDRADKLLIFGHSLGGNMLATLMEGKVARAIARHPMPQAGQEGRAMAPVLGDLVVLLNPASEAVKWTALQRALRAKAGMGDAQNWLSAGVDGQLDAERYSKLAPWRRMFPMAQRPTYVSITATNDWHTKQAGRAVAYDSATGQLFPLSQQVAGERDPERIKTIGHLRASYLAGHRSRLEGPPVGASHEFSVNRGTGTRASFALAAQPEASWCDPASGWLLDARQDQKAQGWSFGDAWDYGLTPDQAEARLTAAENVARGRNPASVQWRHSLNLNGRPGLWSVAQGRSPFWNVRVLDTAVREHAGYVNYPMWCALNQLVLDDVTTPRPADPDLLDDMWMEEARCLSNKLSAGFMRRL